MEVAAEELAPRYMRGYGPLSDEAAAKVVGIAADLSVLVRRTRNLLENN
jgi:hypothetical protein